MEINTKLHSIALALTTLILLFILVSSIASADIAQRVSPTITETSDHHEWIGTISCYMVTL
jgi:hypothetical protein